MTDSAITPQRVLIIAYYFPPLGGSGVQRPVKLARYLKEFGWEPVVLTPEPGAYYHFDSSLLEEVEAHNIEVVRVKARTLFHAGGVRQLRVKPSPWKSRLLSFITSWFFLPDNKKGWIDPGYRRALELHHHKPFDVVFSTAPPYSNLMLAAQFRETTGVPVVMDFRDEWLYSHWISYPTRLHFKKMERIEQQTLHHADAITAVNHTYKERIGQRTDPEYGIHVIPNGYDPAYFEQNRAVVPDPEYFTLLHSGRFYNSIRPDELLEAVSLFRNQHPGLAGFLRLEFQGGLEDSHLERIHQLGVSDITTDHGYLPHAEAVKNLNRADCLFLTLPADRNMGDVTPGKLFEYIGSLKPVLAVVPEGVTQDLLTEYGAAVILSPGRVTALAEAIRNLVEQWKQGKLPKGDANYTARFSRKETAGALSEVMRACLNRNGLRG